jgi:hypothetical protein
MGNREVEDSLERLDKLTPEEARMAYAEQLKMTHDVDDRVRGVEGHVQDVHSDVRDVGDKLDQANRSLSLQTLIIIPRAQPSSQATNSEITFFDGSRPQIRPSIITLHAKLVTMARLSGFFKEVYSINGNPLVPSCGCMENVCYY